MDPNANLRELLDLAASAIGNAEVDRDDPGWEEDARVGDMVGAYKQIQAEAVRMAELVRALDEWLSKGGFLPAAWAR